jgi:hypothetical protein
MGELLAQSPAVVLAVLVWIELRGMRATIHELTATIAVLADRNIRTSQNG